MIGHRHLADARCALLMDLSTEELAEWADLQVDDDRFASPFFHPDYHRAIDAAQRSAGEQGIEVVVASADGGGRRVYWPFERRQERRHGIPPGRTLTDYQGPIYAKGPPPDMAELLRVAGLRTWRFDHVPTSGDVCGRWARSSSRSPRIDLDAGHDAWSRSRRSIKEGHRKVRRLGRELGPLRFEPATTDEAVLSQLMAWKSAQYHRTGAPDLFAVPWSREAVERVAGAEGSQFAGAVSALWAGDQLVAAHAGMRSGSVWHWWIPTYDPELSDYSPGSCLLLELVRYAAADGVRFIDLGRGDEQYKERLANEEVALAEGVVEVSTVVRTAYRAVRRAVRRGVRPG